MQLYFYDTDETIRYRIQRSPNLDEGVISTVLRLLDDNPQIKLNTNIGVDQRMYNGANCFPGNGHMEGRE
jgi:hypothetical protein